MVRDETQAEDYLKKRGFTCNRYSKKEMKKLKTPDFKVEFTGIFSFFCEVKSITEDSWLDEKLDNAKDGDIVGGARPDPVFNRLTDDIHLAVKQFNSVNPKDEYPNVLILVNHDEQCGFNDLLAVLSGNFYDDQGGKSPIYKKFSEGRILNDKKRIDLYIWLDNFKPDQMLWGQNNASHHNKQCCLFKINKDAIVQIDS